MDDPKLKEKFLNFFLSNGVKGTASNCVSVDYFIVLIRMCGPHSARVACTPARTVSVPLITRPLNV